MSYTINLPCFSFTCAQSDEITKQCRYSNKILLPPNVLHDLMAQELFKEGEIMFFKAINTKIEFGQVCGVHEFTASPDICHLPYHIMEDLALTEGENITIEKVNPPKGTYVKLRPHKTDFINLPDPKAILEKIMSKDYPVIAQGQTIAINHVELNRVFRIDIVETKPADVISIVNTDLNVDFDEPIDFEQSNTEPIDYAQSNTEPSPNTKPSSHKVRQFSKMQNVFAPFSGTGRRLGDK
jgi:ubiquitin fusion degradation protein 1